MWNDWTAAVWRYVVHFGSLGGLGMFLTCAGFVFVALEMAVLWRTVLTFRRTKRQLAENVKVFQPEPACIVMCIKGMEPQLDRTMQRLGAQDHPDFKLLVVLDNDDFANRQIVQDYLDQLTVPCKLVFLVDVQSTCTRKLSSIDVALQMLPDDCCTVAFIDADVVPSHNWLTGLQSALQLPGVRVATGIRRYMPHKVTLPGVIRSLWSSFATNWTGLCNIGWGGSLAVSADLIRDTKLRDKIRYGFSEDTLISQYRLSRQQSVMVVPGIVEANPDSCNFGGLVNFLHRQLLAVRMHHSGWKVLAFHGLGTLITLVCGLLHFLFVGGTVGWLGFAAVSMYVSTTIVVAWYGNFIAATPELRPAQHNPFRSVSHFGIYALAFPLTLFVYGYAILLATWCRQHQWRGVTYKIKPGKPVQVVAPVTK